MDTPKQIIVFPWLNDLREPITVCGAEFLPRKIAIARDGHGGHAIASATSYFYEPFIFPDEDGQLKLSVLSPTSSSSTVPSRSTSWKSRAKCCASRQ